jgi:D-glycero-alpha-D-manno-heptose 1-phosphate guanylyltransferase
VIPAVVLAGGLGTRIRAVADGLPKPMLSVCGRPFIEYILDLLIHAGVPSIHLAVSYRRQAIQSHFGTSYRGTRLLYSIEDQPLGTGGAILKCYREHQLRTALVLNGDTLFQVDLDGMVTAHRRANSRITIALRQVSDTSRYGAVTCDSDHRISTFQEKGSAHSGLINGGVYLVDRSAIEDTVLPARFSFERDFIQNNVEALRPLGFISDGYFIDIGIPEDLARARMEIAYAS